MGNTVFTVRPKFLAEESFWSYLLRLAEQNGVPILTMLNSLKTWEQKYVQRADIGLLDITPGSVLNMEQLTGLTGQSGEKLLEGTFAPLLRTFGANQEVQRARFVSGMILDTYRFCPHCLEEMLYYRLLWRMAPITSCAKHGVALTDKCHNCNKHIKLREIEFMGVCPYCGHTLTKTVPSGVSVNDRERQTWMHEALITLLKPGSLHIMPYDTAMRLLYLLCGRQSYFDRQLAEAALPTVLPTLLQHARDSLSQKRTLHLSFLLNTLHEHHFSMIDFLQTTVPNSFVESVRQGMARIADQLSCRAPWCGGYQRPGTLVKTGTSLKRRKSGEVMLYYLACTKCGCEYAIDEDRELQERTYFIEGYRELRKADPSLTGIKVLARSIGFTEDKTRRCLAYFCTRLDSHEWNGARVGVNTSLLERVLNDIRQGVKLKAIQQWDCWESYQQFLVYRFHPDVMRTLIELKRPRPSKGSDTAVKRKKVGEALDILLEKDEDITLGSVCDIVGVCPETIRSWGCNADIARVKRLQRQRRLELFKKSMYEKTDEYLNTNRHRIVSSDELHKHLGIGRTILWRNTSEVAAYVAERIKKQNRNDVQNQ